MLQQQVRLLRQGKSVRIDIDGYSGLFIPTSEIELGIIPNNAVVIYKNNKIHTYVSGGIRRYSNGQAVGIMLERIHDDLYMIYSNSVYVIQRNNIYGILVNPTYKYLPLKSNMWCYDA